MLRRRMPHLRWATGFAHAPIGYCPRRECRFRMIPSRNRCFVAPLQKKGHRGLMRTSGHKLAHAFLRIPSSHGPECPTSVNQQGTRLESRCTLHLI
jgi:hypothetical protein